jgi:hypothetical protein
MIHDCFHCGQEHARRDSKFCSAACRDEFAKTMDFTLTCYCCSADEGDCKTREAVEATGWKDIEPDPDGSFWNYRGLCPRCRKEGRAE